MNQTLLRIFAIVIPISALAVWGLGNSEFLEKNNENLQEGVSN